MISVAILTISDSAVKGTREDLSGPALRRRCESLSWNIAITGLVPDDLATIAGRIREWADASVAVLILTTGGTGVSPRDVTPEATRSILDR